MSPQRKAPSSSRRTFAGRTVRRAAAAFLAGALTVSAAWAGAALGPVPLDLLGGEAEQPAPAASGGARSAEVEAPAPAGGAATSGDGAPATTTRAQPPDSSSLAGGQVLAGAAKRSIEPRPKDYEGTWERDRSKCATLSADALPGGLAEAAETGAHLASTGSPWPENPNCIYMGGFGIGPMNPVSSWNTELGLWVRAFALRDREGDDLVVAVIDGEGYFWDYAQKCEACGIKQITARIAADPALGVKPEEIVIAATHAHSAPDFIGGWGFVPDWYMEQVAETIEQTIRDALALMRPALLEVGEELAREFNHERRDTYRSAEEQQLTWLRAYVPGRGGPPAGGARERPAGQTIATVGGYAAHPTTFGTNDGEAHPDWPGLFEASLEERFGGVGIHLMTGLGNMSASGLDHVGEPAHPTGADDLAGLVGELGTGERLAAPDIAATRTTWKQPVTNAPLTALGLPGFFDRQFSPGPASVQTGEDPEKFQCTSASPVGVEVPASAARIGTEFALTAAPGEIFSNLSNTLKEQSGALVTMPLGQANDALGYMPQSFELNPVGQQGVGFIDGVQGYVFVNYEDAYAIDRCFGDMALETSIELLGELAGAG